MGVYRGDVQSREESAVRVHAGRDVPRAFRLYHVLEGVRCAVYGELAEVAAKAEAECAV